uniref:HUS1 checkpoint clamp component n=1 Tax=Podarcis muralis TaxID=64176 RepID=A0A670JRC6_PODMU
MYSIGWVFLLGFSEHWGSKGSGCQRPAEPFPAGPARRRGGAGPPRPWRHFRPPREAGRKGRPPPSAPGAPLLPPPAMRFRAKISEAGCLAHFSRAVATVAKLAKACALRLTAEQLVFVAGARGAVGGARLWCEVRQGNVFDEFQMEGVAAEKNEIYLEVTPENLSRALKTAQNAKAVKIKLTNKHCPCLTVAVELPSLSSTSRVVTHDIPVGIIPRKLWNDFREPSVPDFDVSIYLPALKTMKSVVERMKNLSNSIVIEANLNGEMNLKIETDLVCVTTHFKDLGNPPWAPDLGVPSRLLLQLELHRERWRLTAVAQSFEGPQKSGAVAETVCTSSTDPAPKSRVKREIPRPLPRPALTLRDFSSYLQGSK